MILFTAKNTKNISKATISALNSSEKQSKRSNIAPNVFFIKLTRPLSMFSPPIQAFFLLSKQRILLMHQNIERPIHQQEQPYIKV